MNPFDSFSVVLLLLLLEDELDEQLLELFVAIIYAELLERVVIKNLEAVNVQDTDNRIFALVMTR